jgi:microcystin degradation protein MlrC
MPFRVLLAGLFHETAAFLDGHTSLAAFQTRRGDELFSAEGDASPLAGALAAGRELGWGIIPAIDMRAPPGPAVDDAAVEAFWRDFKSAAQPALADGVDSIFLVLHGAMVSESFDDVEGEMLARIRRLPGAENIPLCGVVDLHANFTARMAEESDGLIAYRENPHTDAESAARADAALLDKIMRGGKRPVTVLERPPAMWPPTGTGTASDPMKTLEAMARDIERRMPEIAAANVLAGFAFADTPETGVGFTAVTFGDPLAARRELRRLSDWAFEHRALGNPPELSIDDAMRRLAGHKDGPILFVEPSDNIGAGAPGDGTGVLRAFVARDIRNAAVVINDPEAVARASALAPSARATIPIGGKGSRLDAGPLPLEIELVSTSDGRFDLEDPRSHLASMVGLHVDMGRCAVVRCRGVRILLTSRATPPFDLGQFRSQGIAPESLYAVCIKAAVAHRRAWDPVAKASYTVDTPGPCASNLARLPYRKVRRPIYPLD